MSKSQREYLLKIRDAHQQRLQILAERKAQLGFNTPPEIIIEMEDIQSQIDTIDNQLKATPAENTPTTFLSQNYWLPITLVALAVVSVTVFLLMSSQKPSQTTNNPGSNSDSTSNPDLARGNTSPNGSTSNTSIPTIASNANRKGMLAFSVIDNNNTDIYITRADLSDTPQRLTSDLADDAGPAFSPDGEHIAFHSNRSPDRDYHIYILDISSRDAPRQITNGTGGDFNPAWSPDGKKIAFHSNRNGKSAIFIMNIDGSEVRQISPSPDNYFSPAWSPDGKLLVVSSDKCGSLCLYIINSTDGRMIRQITFNKDSARAINAKWSNDGQYIAFEFYFEPNSYIYTVKADGSGDPQKITITPSAFCPSWSPDDTEIAYQSNQSGNNEIYVIDSLGKQTPQKIISNFQEQVYPSWFKNSK